MQLHSTRSYAIDILKTNLPSQSGCGQRSIPYCCLSLLNSSKPFSMNCSLACFFANAVWRSLCFHRKLMIFQSVFPLLSAILNTRLQSQRSLRDPKIISSAVVHSSRLQTEQYLLNFHLRNDNRFTLIFSPSNSRNVFVCHLPQRAWR